MMPKSSKIIYRAIQRLPKHFLSMRGWGLNSLNFNNGFKYFMRIGRAFILGIEVGYFCPPAPQKMIYFFMIIFTSKIINVMENQPVSQKFGRKQYKPEKYEINAFQKVFYR